MQPNGHASVEVMARRPLDKRPERLLLDDQWDAKLANMPRSTWEPISYLASEHDEALTRIEAMNIPEDLEWVRDLALDRWRQVGAWIDRLEQKSVGIQGFRSHQLTHIATAGHQTPQRDSANVVPTVQPGVKRGDPAMGRR